MPAELERHNPPAPSGQVGAIRLAKAAGARRNGELTRKERQRSASVNQKFLAREVVSKVKEPAI